MAKLSGIAIAPRIMKPMAKQDEATITVEAGIDGDARGRKNGRQISILFEDDWADAMADAGAMMDWSERRANLLVSGMRSPQEEGGVFSIGGVRLEVVMETDPCEVMESKRVGLQQAMMPAWRGGVCCRVVAGGSIRVGDAVTYSKA